MTNTVRLIFGLLMLAAGGSALAETGYEPGENDVASFLLNMLFGRTEGVTSIVSVIGAGMSVFNVVALTFGTMMFSYIAVIGTLNTAQDGELLGKKWSSMWIPLRFVFGVALMVPLATGYSTAQHGMLWLAHQGSGVATMIWTDMAKAMASGVQRMGESTLDTASYKKAVIQSMDSIMRAETCSAWFRDRYATSYDGTTGASFGLRVIQREDGSKLAVWGDSSGQSHGIAQCGSMPTASYTIRQTESSATVAFVDEMGNAVPSPIPSPRNDKLNGVMEQLVQAQMRGFGRAVEVIRPYSIGLASRAAGGDWSTQAMAAKRKAAADAYLSEVLPAIGQAHLAYAEGTRLLEVTKKGGWAMSGTLFFALARSQEALKQMENWLPNVTAPEEGAMPLDVASQEAYAESWNMKMDSMFSESWSPGRFLTRQAGTMFVGDPTSPRPMLLQLKDNGDGLMMFAQAAFVAVLAAEHSTGAITSTAKKMPFGGELIADAGKGAFQVLFVLLAVLMGTGVMLSVVLPMMPFIIWAGSLMGWLIAVAEAIIAAPVWLAAHLHPEGDGLTGKASTGYMILLEVMMRPTFMVFGLTLGYLLTEVMIRFVGFAYWAGVEDVQSGSITGPVTALVLVILYVGLAYTLLRTAFSMTHDLPSTIFRWIGGANASHDKGAQFSDRATAQINVGLGRSQGAWGTGLGARNQARLQREQRIADELAKREKDRQAGQDGNSFSR